MYHRPRVIPVLLINNRDLVKTIQFKKSVYLGDPVNAVKIFNRKRIDELNVLDIGAAKNNREPDFALLKDIAQEAFMPLGCGGGITTLEQVRELLRIGYEKVVINTAFVRKPELVRQAARLFGSQSITVSIDAKSYRGRYLCAIEGGQEFVKVTPSALARKAEKLGAGEIILNSIDRDGSMSGYDLNLIREVVQAVQIPVTACGGAGGIKDLKKALKKGGAHAVAGGSMFVFYGRLKAVLITFPTEEEFYEAGIFKD